jgi:hypothetical protein
VIYDVNQVTKNTGKDRLVVSSELGTPKNIEDCI